MLALKPFSLMISTHSAREDGDPLLVLEFGIQRYFNPLRPRGRRHRYTKDQVYTKAISTHSAREDGDTEESRALGAEKISTHSAREDGDQTGQEPAYRANTISTHSAREDGD